MFPVIFTEIDITRTLTPKTVAVLALVVLTAFLALAGFALNDVVRMLFCYFTTTVMHAVLQFVLLEDVHSTDSSLPKFCE